MKKRKLFLAVMMGFLNVQAADELSLSDVSAADRAHLSIDLLTIHVDFDVWHEVCAAFEVQGITLDLSAAYGRYKVLNLAGRLKYLSYDVKMNLLTQISRMTWLEYLDLSDNNIEYLPTVFTKFCAYQNFQHNPYQDVIEKKYTFKCLFLKDNNLKYVSTDAKKTEILYCSDIEHHFKGRLSRRQTVLDLPTAYTELVTLPEKPSNEVCTQSVGSPLFHGPIS